jgi:DNA-binding beta-propeller fold protein YncE
VVESPECVRVFFLSDSKVVGIPGDGRKLNVWTVEEGKLAIGRSVPSSGAVSSAGVSADGKRILVSRSGATDSSDFGRRSVESWEGGDGDTYKRGATAEGSLLAISPDGRLAVVEKPGDQFELCEADTLKPVKRLNFGNEAFVTTRPGPTAVTPDNKWLVAAVKGNVLVLDLDAQPMVRTARTLDIGGAGVRVLCLDPVGKRVAVADLGGRVSIFDLERGALLCRFQPGRELVFGLAFNGDASRLAVSAVVTDRRDDKHFRDIEADVMIYDPVTGRVLHKLERAAGALPRTVAISASGNRVAASGIRHRNDDGSNPLSLLMVWDVPKE